MHLCVQLSAQRSNLSNSSMLFFGGTSSLWAIYSFSDVIYFDRVISDATGTSNESVFSERTEESSAVQYFQVL